MRRMEQEELTLEESIGGFQEGMELSRYCRRLLAEVEQKVEILLQNGELADYKKPEQ